MKYNNRQQLAITQQDEKAIRYFAILNCKCGSWNLMDRLIAMTAPDVFGHVLAKEAILYVAVGYPSNKRRGRIHALFAGDPGEAKSKLMRAAIRLVPKSRYVTAQNSTGKSLMAIIDSENDMKMLRQGSVPLAKNAICGINEIGTMGFDDQKFLLDAMEEGFFSVDKWGMHVDIDCPTSIIGTTNQIGALWKEPDRIDNNEIPILRQLLDRFDLLIAFRRKRGEEENRKYADKKSQLDEKQIDYDCSFLMKYLHYAKSLTPAMTEEARVMLNEFWVRLAEKGFDSRRLHESIFSVAKARACLHLKDTVEPEDAMGAMEFFNKLISQYKENVRLVGDPRDVAYTEIINLVLESAIPTEFIEAVKVVCENNPQIASYIGKRFSTEDNKRLRNIRDLLVEKPDPRIAIISLKPLTMMRSDRSDRSVVPTEGGSMSSSN
jgi:DNA replicative helicase MCM subunit Mcm2 (Cdc46/Mcm family)